jgi:hypothetical protein
MIPGENIPAGAAKNWHRGSCVALTGSDQRLAQQSLSRSVYRVRERLLRVCGLGAYILGGSATQQARKLVVKRHGLGAEGLKFLSVCTKERRDCR